MSWRGWGRAEIMILRQCAGTMTVESIGKLIGRTGDAVRTKARELGISMILKGDFHPSAKFRQSDIELARQLHQCGVPRREIAEKLEMPLGMINQYVYFERSVGNDRGRDVTNEAAQLVWHLVMAEGGEINWELDDGSRMVLKAEKQEPPQ